MTNLRTNICLVIMMHDTHTGMSSLSFVGIWVRSYVV